jgi:predicted phosphodiesterase
VSGPLDAARTADLLIERGFPSVRGDQDRILVELWQAGTSARSDFRQLERKHFDWMASMPPTLIYREDVFLCHGSPRDDAAFWLDYIATDGSVRASPIDVIEADAEGIIARVILCGHTHVPRVIRLRDGRMIVNPGSVGLPGYDRQGPVSYVVEVGTPHACYAILENTREG